MTRLPTNPITGPVRARAFAGLALTLALALVPAVNLRADAPSALLHIANTGPDTEGLPTFRLDWNAVSNATYLVQSADGVAPGGTWNTLDAVTPPDKVGSYQFQVVATDSTGRSSPPSKFYRLVLPQPQIFSVEPAIVAPGLAVDLYVLGQCFDTNDVLLINGVPQTNVVYTSSQLVKPVFTPGAPGTYTVQLAVGGQVVSSFNVLCADALANPELVLQGPPDDPPASPLAKNSGHIAESIEVMPEQIKYALVSGSGGGGGGGGGSGGMPDLFNTWPSEYHPPAMAARTRAGNHNHIKFRATWASANGSGSDRTAGGHAWNNTPRYAVGSLSGAVPFSGEVQQQVLDLAVEGRGLDFIWARTYRSRTASDNSFGPRWTCSYDVHLQPLGGDIVIHDGTGRADRFLLQTNGTYTCPEFFREGTLSNGVFRLTFADTGYWEFNPLDGTATAGKLAHIVDRNGNTMSLGYDLSGRLAQVVDDLGRTNTVGYDSDGRMASVTDFSGRTVTYAYYQLGEIGGSPGDLKSVTSPPVTGTPNGNDFPDGKTVTYTYSTGYTNDAENHLLVSVIDANGKTAYSHVYQHNQTDLEFLHCIASQEGTTKTERITVLPQIATPVNHFAVVRCIVNDPVGNVTESFFDARNRCVIEREFTGRATPEVPVTDTLNRPTGKLRSTDPDFYEARWSWNNDSLCTLAVAPGGQQVQCVFQSDFDPTAPARKRADLRVLREIAPGGVDLDGDGVADVTDRTWRYDYDPRFGSDPTASLGKKLYVGNLPFAASDSTTSESIISNMRQRVLDLENVLKNLGLLSCSSGGKRFGIGDTSPANPLGRKGWDGTIKGLVVPDGNGVAIKTKGTGADNNRVTFSRDKLKGTTKTQGDFHQGSHFSVEFTVSATDPRGNVTTGTYDANGNRVKVKFYWDRQGSAEQGYAYDTHGQLTAVTNAPDANGRRRVDVIAYGSNPAATDYGRIAHLIHDANGVALTTSYEYDARGNLTRYVDPRTNDWLYAYNALDQCVRAQSPTNITSRCATDFSYDANDNLVQCSVEVRDDTDTKLASKISSFVYDQENRLIRVTEPVSAKSSAITEFDYDDNNQLSTIRSPLAVLGLDSHNIQAFTYDERGLLFQSTAAPGTGLCGTNEYSYTSNGWPATKKYVDDQDALKADLTYDGFDRLVRVTDAMGNVVSCAYDCNDNPVYSRVDAESVDVPGSAGNHRYSECRWKFDALDRCVQSTEAFFDPATQTPIGSGVAVSSCAYAPNGDCVSETDSLGHTTTYAYDTAGRPASITSPDGKSVVVAVRDAFGNATRSTQTDTPDLGGPAQVFFTTFTYDSLNRCVSSSDNVGNTASCAYDSLDRVVRATDPNGNDTTYGYDYPGNCLDTTNYVGSSSVLPATVISSSHAAYDVNSRCIASTDANGNTTSYAYDSLDRLVTTTCADGTACHLVWSPRSNLITEEDANGTTITNTYDLCDRIIHRDIAARGPAVASTTFETFAYDGCSRLVLASNDVSRLDFSYDSLGNTTGGSQDGLAQSATHDTEGNLLALTYPGGRVVTYSYDALDQVSNIATAGGGVSHPHLAQFAYAGPGRLASLSRDNGINSQIDWDGLVSPPNPGGDYGWQQVSRVHDTGAMPVLVPDVAGTYSRTQSKLTSTNATSGQNAILTYDALDQLVESAVSIGGVAQLDTVYGLDGNGNRQHVSTNGVTMLPDYTMDSALPPGDFQMNRYTATPFGAQQYDANGNLMVRASAISPTFYHYDYADRLVEVDALNGEGFIGPAATFTYDALGRRISKTTYPPTPLAPVTTQYVCDIVEYKDGEDGTMHTRPGRILEARVDGTLSQAYVHATGLNDGNDNVDFGQKPMVIFTGAGEALYMHGDDLDNTLALADSSGSVLERYAYDDYGQPQFLAPDGTPLVDSGGQPLTTSSVGNPFLFHGMEWDGETGLLGDGGGDYFDPRTGRAVRGKVKVIRDTGSGRVSRAILKGYFERGDKPTQAQFGTLIDSTVNKLDDRYLIGLRVSSTAGNNPWSGGNPSAMKTGKVKFFNDAKGFGMVVGPGGGGGGSSSGLSASRGIAVDIRL